MYTYNIFAYLYFKSTKFYLSPTLTLVLSRMVTFLQFFFLSLFFLFFSFSSFLRRTRESTRFTQQFRSRSRFFSNPFCSFFRFIIHFWHIPYLCNSLWSIIVTASRMISRRRSASSPLSSPRISRWRITRTIIKIRTLFRSFALSLTLFCFPSLFFLRLCVSHILNCFKGTCIVIYKYRQRDTIAPFLRLFVHHIVVVTVARRFSFSPFTPFFFFFVEISNRAKRECASRRNCVQTYRRENESNILKEYNEGRISAVRSMSITFPV